MQLSPFGFFYFTTLQHDLQEEILIYLSPAPHTLRTVHFVLCLRTERR